MGPGVGYTGWFMTRDTNTRFFGHPAGLSTLFFTELWERFGYYGMRALLVLFMTAAASSGGLGYDVPKAYAIYGLYTASVYGLSLPGGWVADRILGQQRAVLAGGVLIAIGYLMLALPAEPAFFAGMVIVAFGTGLLKPNISTIVGQIYQPGDPRRDSGFSVFYMGINIGSTLAPLACGWVGERINWRLGFAMAGAGMVLGVITYLRGLSRLGAAGLKPVEPPTPEIGRQWRRSFRNGLAGVAGLFALLAALHFSGLMELSAERLVNGAGFVLFAITLGLFGWMFLGGGWTPDERKRLAVIAVLFWGSALYWAAFEQAGSSFNLFAKHNTGNVLWGFNFPASWFQSLNAGFIIVLAGVFAWVWIRLGDRQPGSVMKFSLALLCATLSFVVMMAAAQGAGATGRVSPMWLVVTYLLQTVGELLLSPVGLSAMTKLAPARVGGLMMGVWFLSLSMGNYLAGRTAAYYGNLPPYELFKSMAMIMAVAAVALALLARPVARMMRSIQ
ncbi:MAG: peptide MFS transporter [Candidatus Solibacter usitatus]|nr:peptide MFS transporter [Candidatus Solibacter usitatus]